MAEAKRRPFAIYDWSPSMTKQSFAEEVDINKILERARAGQDIRASVTERVAQYGDFSNVPSYQAALDLINRANGMFMSLDANIRERFFNDPRRMVMFLQDSSNYDEAVKLGLVLEKPEVAPVSESRAKASSDAAPTKAKPAEGKA